MNPISIVPLEARRSELAASVASASRSTTARALG